jgi:hypothetical protein
VEAASAPVRISATASAVKTVESAARAVTVLTLVARGVMVLVISLPFPGFPLASTSMFK